MKKLSLLVFTILLIFVIYSNKQIETELVFNENEYINNYDNDYFYISSKDIILNTNNLLDYFNDANIKIMGLYPNLDKIYDEDLKFKLNYYSFNPLYDNRTNINSFTNSYVSLLKNNNYIDEANMVYFDGININKILVYAPYNSIYLHNLDYKIFDYNVKEF